MVKCDDMKQLQLLSCDAQYIQSINQSIKLILTSSVGLQCPRAVLSAPRRSKGRRSSGVVDDAG